MKIINEAGKKACKYIKHTIKQDNILTNIKTNMLLFKPPQQQGRAPPPQQQGRSPPPLQQGRAPVSKPLSFQYNFQNETLKYII